MGSNYSYTIMIVVTMGFTTSCVVMMVTVINSNINHITITIMVMDSNNNCVAMIVVVMGFCSSATMGPSNVISCFLTLFKLLPRSIHQIMEESFIILKNL